MSAARRIFPAPRSSRPLHPPSLPRRPSSSSPEGAGSGGCGGGRAGPGVGSAGDRPPTGDRPPPGAFPPRRCAATGSGTAGKARRGRWLGGPRPAPSSPRPRPPPGGRGSGWRRRWRRDHPPSVTAPRQQHSPNPGAEGARPVAALSPLPAPTPAGAPREGVPPRGGAPAFLVGGRATPPTARPLSHPLPAPPATGARAGGGGADCPQCAPGGSRRRARGGSLGATRASLEEGDGGASARGRRRCRLPTRPVLKHGPRSLTRARVRGSHESRRGAMKVKAGALAGRGGIPRPLQSAEGAPPARLARRAGEVEHERTC